MVGKTFGHYEILEPLGAGGMGEVYRARDTKLDRDVAIKVLPEDFATDPDRLARFEREAKLLASLNHGNIAAIYGLEDEVDQRFIVMEVVEGETLAERIARSGRIEVDEALDIARQIAEALESAHESGVIHRDLKPANVMLTPAGKVKVLDFGLAKAYEADGSPAEISPDLSHSPTIAAATRTGVILGTAAYMSPEQARGKPVDKRTDIWSFGCLLFEMLTGSGAFERETVSDTIAAILKEEPDWERLPADVSPGARNLMGRSLQKDARQRLRDIGDAWVEINEVLVSSTGGRPILATTGDLRRRTVTMRLGYVVAAVGLLAAAAAVGVSVVKFAGPAETVPTPAPSHRQITFAGDATDAAISPDGTSVAYVTGESGDHQRLMLADLAGGQPLEIFNGSTVLLPEWSPDGSAIAVSAIRDLPVPARVYRVPRLGGDARRLGRGAFKTWSPDGSQIAFALQDGGFTVFSESTGESVHIPLEGYDFNKGLSWSPMGNRLAVLTSSTASGGFELLTVDPSGNDRRSVIALADPMSAPRWAPDGDAIYVLRHRNNLADVLRVDLTDGGGSSGEPAVVLSGLQAAATINSTFNLTADGRTLAYSTRLEYSNLWLAELTGDASDEPHETRQLTSGTSLIERPSISPDGRWIAYSAQTSAGANIFKMPITGGDPVQLTFSDAYQTSPAWAPDGNSIAFSARDAGVANVWVMRSDGTEPREFPQTEVSAGGMRVVWAPGDQLLYQRPGNQDFFYLNVATGEQQPLVPDAAFERRPDEGRGYTFYPEYSPDGAQVAIAWNRHPAQAIWLITREPYSERRVSERSDFPIGWSADERWIFVVQAGGRTGRDVGRVPTAGGEGEVLFTLPGGIRFGSVDPSGTRIVTTVGAVQSDVFVVEDFDRRQR